MVRSASYGACLGRRGARALSAAILTVSCVLASAGCAHRLGAAPEWSGCAEPCAAIAPCAAPCAQPCPAPCPAPCATPCAVEAPCPPNPCGEVWCRVWVPPVSCTQAETYCVKPACKKCVWVAPRYGTRPKLACIAPPVIQETRKPGVWTTKRRDVLVCPPREGWRPVCCPPTDPCSPCPAPQECFEKVCQPAVWGEEACPVCIQPDVACLKYRPAQYKVVEERYLIEAGHCEEVEEPAVFDTRFCEVCVTPGHWEWRRNPACETPPPAPCAPPPAPVAPQPYAIQVEMKDADERGQEAGIFPVGAVVRYDLNIIADKSESVVRNIQVVFDLPPELEFVRGGGEHGVVVSGAGRSARSNLFSLPVEGSLTLQVLARVKNASMGTNVQFTARVLTADGHQLAIETESTTVGSGGTR